MGEKERNDEHDRVNVNDPLLSSAELTMALQHSQLKLEETGSWLKNFSTTVLRMQPCKDEKELRGYRCRFTLQIVTAMGGETSDDPNVRLQYAIRKDGKPFALPNDTYVFANSGLRALMRMVLQELNCSYIEDEELADDKYPSLLRQHLASVSFLSSWDSNKSKLITFHYKASCGLGLEEKHTHDRWVAQADQLRNNITCNAGFHGTLRIAGRAKKILLRSSMQTKQEQFIGTHDALMLLEQPGGEWKINLCDTAASGIAASGIPTARVHLFKPEGAFCHPNANVMLSALAWLLRRISIARKKKLTRQCRITQNNDNPFHLQMLELYCGCGAHTIPIAKSGLVSCLVAIELDDRLVHACERNVVDNQLEDVVQVISQDVGDWAKHGRKWTQFTKKTNGIPNTTIASTFDIVLVDPPRQGLDENVRTWIRSHTQDSSAIADILYISCGREALVRDLNILQEAFDVEDCLLLDLFPGTESVESLVHLRRKR